MSSDTVTTSASSSSTADGEAAPGLPAGRFARARRLDRSAVVLAVILTSQLMVVLDATIVNVALPDMKAALHFSDAGLSWVLNAYTLTFGGLLLLGARAGDLLGRRGYLPGRHRDLHRRLAGRRVRHHRLVPAGGPGAAGRRRRAGRTVVAGPAGHHVPRGTRADARHRAVHRGLHRRRRHRPDLRRNAHPVGVLALGAVRQRPDRHRGIRGRPFGTARDRPPARSVRPGRCDHLHARHGLAGLRLRPGGDRWLV